MDSTSPNDSHPPSRPRPLFIYGTLRAKPLLAWLLTGHASHVSAIDHMLRPAFVSGYTRLTVRNADYPAVVRRVGCRVDGYLLQVDSASQRKKLDDFEGELYVREPVTVEVMGRTGETLEADMYVWAGDEGMLTTEAWELVTFVEERLEDWLDLFDGMEMVGEDYG